MRAAFFTFGSGAGNIAVGASVFNGLRRAGTDVEFTVITDSDFGDIYSSYLGSSFKVIQIKPEPEKLFFDDLGTELFHALQSVKPEIIIVFMLWMPVMPLLEDFDCPKILLVRQCPLQWFSMQTGPHDSLDLNLHDYSAAYSIEPGFLPEGFIQLPSMILRNPGRAAVTNRGPTKPQYKRR